VMVAELSDQWLSDCRCAAEPAPRGVIQVHKLHAAVAEVILGAREKAEVTQGSSPSLWARPRA
jgi:hypothetical protein